MRESMSDTAGLGNEQKEPVISDALPTCPYCGQDPAMVSTRLVMVRKFQAMAIFCGNAACRKLFALEVVGMQPVDGAVELTAKGDS
jgi:hypothetical protein